jgi:hypothetical protein
MDQICSRHLSRWLFALLLTGCVAGGGWAQAQTPKPSTASPTPVAGPSPASSLPDGLTAGTPEPPDKVVLKIGDQQFTKAEIDSLILSLNPRDQQAIAAQGKKQLGDQYAMMVMLAQQARLHHLDETPEFRLKLAFEKEQLEARSYEQEIVQQAKVTPEEVQQYYTAHAADYDEVMVRRIAIRIKAADTLAAPGHPLAPVGVGLPPEEAKAKAEAIRKELAAGTDIKKVVAEFNAPSQGVNIDAEPHAIRHIPNRPDAEKEAFTLKDGEVGEIQSLPQMLAFVQRTGHTRHELKDVAPEIERAVKQQKIEAAVQQVKKSTPLWMDDQYFAAAPKPPERPTMGPPVVGAPPKP